MNAGIVSDLVSVFSVYLLLCLFLALGAAGVMQVIGRGND